MNDNHPILMTGNEAIARGVYEAGCHVSSAYPGTPSTEIQENIGKYQEIYAEWAPNEKVALEVAAGAAMGGARAFASMKHVGLNVAADPLFTVAYTGVTGALVINTSDEPGMHSSQNEQDNRRYAEHAKIPLLVPSDSQECLDYTKAAFIISEKFDTPVLLRTTTRVCHSKSLVHTGSRNEIPIVPYVKNIRKNLMIPSHARLKHPEVEDRLRKLSLYAESTPLNRVIPPRNTEAAAIGIITGGISYQYAREVFGDSVSYLVLGFMFPFPENMIQKFADSVEQLFIIEENEPFIENTCKKLGIACLGKEVLPLCDELSPDLIRAAFLPDLKNSGAAETETPPASSDRTIDKNIPQRPPALCPGCPHRGVFTALARYRKHVISTDIGCYTLGALPPLDAGDFLFCMGSSISSGMGFAKALQAAAASEKSAETPQRKVIAVIGDSTFFHSGITGLINVLYSKTPMVILILDNRITAMTGHQHNPGTGKTLQGADAPEIDLFNLVSALGFTQEQLFQVNPHDLEAVRNSLKEAMDYNGPAVIITKAPCALLPEVKNSVKETYYQVDRDICITCKACIRTGCPAIRITGGKSLIDPDMCAACGVCMQVCKPGAISGPFTRTKEKAHV